MRYITSIETNNHNEIIIYGVIGKRRYYYYTKTQAIRLYNKEARKSAYGK